MAQKILIIAGEASGDLHGSNLVKAMLDRQPDLELFGVGGDRMLAHGFRNLYHSTEVAFLGFVEVIKHLPFIRKMMHTLLDAAQTERPDLIILIDYPGFNLRFAERIRKLGLTTPIFYYISPQVWAWHKSRVPKMAQLIDRMAVIFPFEVEIFEEVGLDTHFVGHPLMETLSITQDRMAFCAAHGLDADKQIVGLLPGSRRQEIERLLDTMLQSASQLKQKLPDLQLTLAIAPTLPDGLVDSYLQKYNLPITCVSGHTYNLINAADVMLVKSGTSTLETGIIGKPMVIIYKINWLSYLMAHLLVKVDHIGMVNVVAQKRVVPELIQHEATPERIVPLLHEMLTDHAKRHRIETELQVVQQRLGDAGAADRAAQLALDLIAH